MVANCEDGANAFNPTQAEETYSMLLVLHHLDVVALEQILKSTIVSLLRLLKFFDHILDNVYSIHL